MDRWLLLLKDGGMEPSFPRETPGSGLLPTLSTVQGFMQYLCIYFSGLKKQHIPLAMYFVLLPIAC